MGDLVRACRQFYVSMIQQNSLYCYKAEIMCFLKMYGLTIFSLNKVAIQPIKYQDVF